ncbi:hypothetical protein KIH39_17535 [Telmatocola sphagniphila]|uniref:Uncharacterized protein n=1 Tax=Telmatocola sphagniphila TaxID=1123043 RepID=A0A8E6B3H1_9BACT|nr:hypothetical protein [Telmatocola sphagniphila]QVL30647.1 hypothetical protein KIH39_17535 [Telmatocola sphagniphila]
MADSPRIAPLGGPSGDRLNYKPVSGFAVAAVVFSVLYTVIILALTIAAFVAKKPILIQELLLLPALGLVFSIIGRSQIKKSEGTRVGLGLCNIAWWLSIVGGVMFAMYILANDFALRRQSQETAKKFMDAMKEGKWNTAFLLTVDPGRRASVTSDDAEALEAEFGKPMTAGFRQNELIRIFNRYSSTGEVNYLPLGVQSWESTPRGYEFRLGYQILCPEGIYGVSLVLKGFEGPNIRGRQWSVHVPQAEAAVTLVSRSPYGKLYQDIGSEAFSTAIRFVEKLNSNQLESAYLMTRPIAEMSKNEANLSGQLLLSGGTLAGIEKNWHFPPEFSKEFLRLSGDKTPSPQQLKMFEQIITSRTLRPAGASKQFANTEKYPEFSASEKETRLTFPVEFSLPNPPGAAGSGRIIVESTNPEFIALSYKLRQDSSKDPTLKAEVTNDYIKTAPPRDWRIVGFVSNFEPLESNSPAAAAKPGP